MQLKYMYTGFNGTLERKASVINNTLLNANFYTENAGKDNQDNDPDKGIN